MTIAQCDVRCAKMAAQTQDAGKKMQAENDEKRKKCWVQCKDGGTTDEECKKKCEVRRDESTTMKMWEQCVKGCEQRVRDQSPDHIKTAVTTNDEKAKNKRME